MDGGGDTALGQTHQAEVRGGKQDGGPREEVVVSGVLQNGVESEGYEGCVGQGEKDFGEWGVYLLDSAPRANGWGDEGDEEKNDEECRDDHGLSAVERAVPVDVPRDEEGD